MSNVSTKPKICIDCGLLITITSNRQIRCNICKGNTDRKYLKQAHAKRYIRKGYNQKAEANNCWRGGIGIYKHLLDHIAKCERCQSDKFLLVHHKDRNRRNNELVNLEKLCKSCHQKEHKVIFNIIKMKKGLPACG